MNTDNMALSGETIDYGPCAFLDTYHPGTVFSSIDEGGRYAYGNQPAMAHWNLTRFAESLLPLLGSTQDEAVAVAVEILNTFPDLYEQAWLTGMHQKLGLQTQDTDSTELITSLLTWMEQTEADFTNTFRALASPELLCAPSIKPTISTRGMYAGSPAARAKPAPSPSNSP
jgi:uncharacterized protein YdiU (UPF0061 family)